MKKLSGGVKFVLFNLLAALVVCVGISYYVLECLEDYTQHGYSVAVPSFYAMTPEEALEVADYDGLRVQIVDSLYDDDAKPGTVVEQYPQAGERVKENRLIYLTMNARNPEKIVFPNLKNAAYRQTLQTLHTRGFTIGSIVYAPSEFRNLVLAFKYEGREVQAGDLLPKGARIDIVLGRGKGDNMVYVPRVLGKTLAEATDMVRMSYLNLGEIVPDGSIRDRGEYAGAIVYRHYPGGERAVQAGSPVKLYITRQEDAIAALDSLMVTE